LLHSSAGKITVFLSSEQVMHRLSVVIITLNEEKNIARCLASVKDIAEEIVVIDSGSGDRTVMIAESYGARVVFQQFQGYIEQKNIALAAAANEYILSLDGDEALSPELRKSILTEKQNGFSVDGYEMNRRNWFINQWIIHGTWYPDRKLRLVRKGVAVWGGINPHDKLMPEKGIRVRRLEGDILHYTFHTMDEYVSQLNKFSSISARAMFEKGRRAHMFNLFWNPTVAFIRSYLITGGFRDGFNGYVIAKQTANLTFLKYAKLLQLQKNVQPNHQAEKNNVD